MPAPSPKPITPHHEVRGAPLLDIPAVARRLDVCEKTVRRFIARGELRAHRIGRQIRVSEEDFLRFLDARR
jgi:excisionase family DNA binding protein